MLIKLANLLAKGTSNRLTNLLIKETTKGLASYNANSLANYFSFS
jgi:hypothetical protein